MGHLYMTDTEHSQSRRELASWLQLIVMIVAVLGVFYTVGKRDQVLTDLKVVTSDLVKTTTNNSGSVLVQQAEIENIKRRINDLEGKSK